jgi:integrase
MAHIRKQTWTTKDDEIHFRYYVIFRDPAGRQHKAGGFKLKKDAEAAQKRIEAEVAAGTYGRETLTFGEFYERWIGAKGNSLKPSTLIDIQSAFKVHVLPALGGKRLDKLEPLDIQGFVSALCKKERRPGSNLALSPATVGKIYRYLRSCLRQAESWQLIDRAPTSGIILPRSNREELDYLQPEQMVKLLDVVREPERTLFELLSRSGLRLGEGLALRWRDIDFDMNAIRVERSWSPAGGFHEPKTDSSRRAVVLLPSLAATLRNFHQAQGSPAPEALLFTHDGEQPLNPGSARRRFCAALEVAELRHVTIHSLRHSFASVMLASGANIKALQRALGHSSATMTLDVYSHLLEESVESSALKADQIFTGAGGKLAYFPRREIGNSPK